jgi:serine/threonine protein phosphatase PrpC
MGAHAGIEAAGWTNVKRSRPGNEDAFLIATLERSIPTKDRDRSAAHGATAGTTGTLLMVADGKGGECDGAFANGVTGRTSTMALVLWPVLYVAHVGDTRCYLLRAGRLSRLTLDHAPEDGVEHEGPERVDPGSELHHVLWNSLGGGSALPEPRIVKLNLELGDRLLLCSDGLTKQLADARISSVLCADESGSSCCATLVELADARGGSDDLTVLVADVRPSSPVANSNAMHPHGDSPVALH